MRACNQFGRLLALGITTTLSLYLFINVAMVMGLIPVVGVPLPMISYGGTAMLMIMLGIGLVLGGEVLRDVRHGRDGVEEDSARVMRRFVPPLRHAPVAASPLRAH